MLRVYRIFTDRRKPQPSELRAHEPERLGDWGKELAFEDQRRRNRAILKRMTEREERDRRTAIGFWRYWGGRSAPHGSMSPDRRKSDMASKNVAMGTPYSHVSARVGINMRAGCYA